MPTSASYSDTTAANGTTYYYVVTAVNSAGESSNSIQVHATPAAASSNPPPTTFGVWTDVTPNNVSLASASCGNYGVETVQADPGNPSNLYFEAHCQGIWKSTDFGLTWTGPINTGTNGAQVSDCAGGITIWPGSTAATPTLYLACIRGSGLGFWRSTDGGVNWTTYFVAPSGSSRQDYYPPVVDPYDGNHLVMAGHEMNYIVESTDGGQTDQRAHGQRHVAVGRYRRNLLHRHRQSDDHAHHLAVVSADHRRKHRHLAHGNGRCRADLDPR